MQRVFGFACVLTVAAVGHASAQAVRGQVVDDSTGWPVVGAAVALITVAGAVAATAQSDTGGAFRVATRPGEYRLRVRRIGYGEWVSAPLTLRSGQDLGVSPRLTASAVQLEPAEVTGQPTTGRRPLSEFVRRRENGLGKFITRAEFEDWSPRQLSDVLMQMPGMRLVRNPCFMMDATVPNTACYNRMIQGADTRRFIFRPRGGPITFGQGRGRGTGQECGVLIYVDGRYVGDNLSLDLDVVPVDQVEAVEAYTGASEIPTELNRTGSACGVIVIWTR